MTKIIIVFMCLFSFNSFSECVHERNIVGSELKFLTLKHEVFVKQTNERYIPLKKIKINPNKRYNVQLLPKKHFLLESTDSHLDYNKNFLKYYTYTRLKNYIKSKSSLLMKAGLDVRTIGKSLEGRDLYAITPKKLQDKKTILMFGRHHGDEGTANWIIEGFIDEYLSNSKFRNENQLILYPMINPDGAEAHSRYNSNGRDLNRSWNKNVSSSHDEIKIYNKHLKSLLSKVGKNIFITLDMHGSFTKDFIYRVRENYVNLDYYNKQQIFIEALAMFDTWQNGNYQLSNGDPAMARIVLINTYKLNAMTHETIKDIPLKNSGSRSLETLKAQGKAIIDTIML